MAVEAVKSDIAKECKVVASVLQIERVDRSRILPSHVMVWVGVVCDFGEMRRWHV